MEGRDETIERIVVWMDGIGEMRVARIIGSGAGVMNAIETLDNGWGGPGRVARVIMPEDWSIYSLHIEESLENDRTAVTVRLATSKPPFDQQR